jgi:hypothetical protein
MTKEPTTPQTKVEEVLSRCEAFRAKYAGLARSALEALRLTQIDPFHAHDGYSVLRNLALRNHFDYGSLLDVEEMEKMKERLYKVVESVAQEVNCTLPEQKIIDGYTDLEVLIEVFKTPAATALRDDVLAYYETLDTRSQKKDFTDRISAQERLAKRLAESRTRSSQAVR